MCARGFSRRVVCASSCLGGCTSGTRWVCRTSCGGTPSPSTRACTSGTSTAPCGATISSPKSASYPGRRIPTRAFSLARRSSRTTRESCFFWTPPCNTLDLSKDNTSGTRGVRRSSCGRPSPPATCACNLHISTMLCIEIHTIPPSSSSSWSGTPETISPLSRRSRRTTPRTVCPCVLGAS